MDPNAVNSIMTVLTQFGAAGLIGLLWILERRSASQRDRQLHEAHQRLMARELDHSSLLDVVKDNTAAMKAMEYTQRRLVEHLQRLETADRANAA